jgi:PAS domain S-box-containing protein
MTGRANSRRLSAYWRPFTAAMRVLISLALLSALPLGATGQSKTVLTIYSEERLLPANIVIDAALRDSLGLGTDNPPTYLSEFLDFPRFSSSDYDRLLSDFLRSKYAGQHIDVIVASGPLALEFLRRHQTDLFTAIPVVLCGIERGFSQPEPLPTNFVGVPVAVEPLPTIELALRLQPDAREIVLVTGASEFDRRWEARLRRDLAHLQTSVPIRYLSGLPLDDVLRELSRLSPNTIVFSPGLLRDGAGRTYIARNAIHRMAVASAAPIYGIYSTQVGSGIVGGYMFTMEDVGRQAAGLVRRILDGEKLSQADVPATPPSRYVFDWNQLQRWHIPEKKLPPGSIVLYREFGAWQRYKWYIVGGIAILLAQALLIFGLLWQRSTKRKVEASLVERLTFEKLLSDLSTTFINLPEEQVDVNIENGLGRIAEFLKMDRVTLFEFSRDRTEMTASFSWTSGGTSPAPALVKAADLSWWRTRLLRGEVALASDLNDLPEEALAEREYFLKMGVFSAASVPLKAGGQVNGAISFISGKRRVSWTEDLLNQVRILGEVFWNALQRKQSMKALLTGQTVLRESEERFRLVADTAPALIWMSGTDKLCTFFNKGWLDFTGRSIDLEIGNGWAEGVHLEDFQTCFDTYLRAFDARQKFTMEYRLRRYDGEYRWVLDIGVPRFNQDGSFAGFIGSCVDVTDRKLAEEALSGVNRKLIEAEERERTRIARDLHEDIGQRLALLAIGIEELKDDLPNPTVQLLDRIDSVWKQTLEVSTDVKASAHELYSPRLEYLGIAAVMRSFCGEFGERKRVEIDFRNYPLPTVVPPDVSICLFRVLQEGLHNGLKHSGVQEFQVQLWGASDEIHLTVSDSGAGFDLEAARKGRGLGLIRIEQRLSLLKGTFSIDSQPKRGTTIHARVPLNSGSTIPAAG